MYEAAVADAAPVAPSRSGGLLPLAAICCLGTLAFLVAVTIVLALIPIYLPTKQVSPVTTSNDDNTFQLQYSSSSVGADKSVAGTINNLDEVRSALGLGDDVAITKGYAKSTYQRRRRSLFNRRQKRSVGMALNFVCQYKIVAGCSGKCRQSVISRANTAIAAAPSFPSIPCQIGYGSAVVSFSLAVSYVGIVQQTAVLPGYGPVTSTNFVAINSGSIFSPSTWLGGVVPFVGCGVTVASGVSLSIPVPSLIIPLASLSVSAGATLALGSPGTSGFSFAAGIALTVSGTFSYQGSGGSLVLPSGSSFSFQQGAAFVGASVAVQVLTSSGNVAASVTVSSSTTSVSIITNSGGGVVVSTQAPTTTSTSAAVTAKLAG